MAVLVTGMAFIYVVATMFSLMLEGSSGVAVTGLTSAITATSTYLPISSSSGFSASSDRVFMDEEEIAYDSIQSGVDANCPVPPCLVLSSDDRGINGTEKKGHASGARVYVELSGILNGVVGFSSIEFAEADSPGDYIFAITHAGTGFLKFVAKVILWDYSFLEGNAVYIKYAVLYPMGIGFLIAIITWVRNVVLG